MADASTAPQGRSAYLVASIVAQVCALARYTFLARLLGPEQLGIAVAIILTSQFMDCVTDSGNDRFLVQDRRGDEPAVLRLIHSVWVLRGIVIAASLLALSVPLSAAYDRPALSHGLMILSIAPLIAGAAHLDYRRAQRHSNFGPESRVLIASEVVSLAVTLGAAILIRDYTAILYGLIARSVMIVLVSHLVAERRYAVGYSKQDAGRLFRFATPLMLNGLLLFFSSQGDRILVGAQAGLSALGLYSATLLLAFAPSAIIQRFMTAVHLPLVAKGGVDAARQHAAADTLGSQCVLLTIAMGAGFALLAPSFIPIMFGPSFALPPVLVAAIGLLQMIRFARLWPVTIALALGNSGTVLLSNLLRLIAFPAAYVAYASFGTLLAVVLAFVATELMALLVSILVVQKSMGDRSSAAVARFAMLVASILLILAWAAAASGVIAWPIPAVATLPIIALLWRGERQSIGQAIALGRDLMPFANARVR